MAEVAEAGFSQSIEWGGVIETRRDIHHYSLPFRGSLLLKCNPHRPMQWITLSRHATIFGRDEQAVKSLARNCAACIFTDRTTSMNDTIWQAVRVQAKSQNPS